LPYRDGLLKDSQKSNKRRNGLLISRQIFASPFGFDKVFIFYPLRILCENVNPRVLVF